MINERNMMVCDVCGRQILTREINDSSCIGPRTIHANIIGINKHACRPCLKDMWEWDIMGGHLEHTKDPMYNSIRIEMGGLGL